MYPILALWATPRTVSTAFERMMIERGDHVVFDEPFSRPYYFGPGRRSERFRQTLERSSVQEVLEDLRMAARDGPVFLKDMAYQAVPYLEDETLTGFVHTFLVRDPRWALPSLARIWPDFTAQEAGYGAQLELFERVQAGRGTPVVIDSDDLCRAPHATVRSWCESVGIPFVASALRWEPGMQPQWRLWRSWYTEAATSTGFRAPTNRVPPAVDDEHLRAAVDEALPIYERLAAHALRPAV